MLPGIRSLAAFLQLELFRVYPLFGLQMCWLRMLAPWPVLSGIRSLAAFLQLELFRVYPLFGLQMWWLRMLAPVT
ncbi:hypothetical protein RTE01_09250 [Raoultella terrigena]|nr:hypothetical protein RTE01_09250 [Raoultella terrigena]